MDELSAEHAEQGGPAPITDDAPKPDAVRHFFRNKAPKKIRQAIEAAGKKDILSPSYPYSRRISKKEYARQMAPLQIELVRMHDWVRRSGARVVVLFEGRDAAGKGGTIKRFTENLNPRTARVVALSTPSDVEAGQWYFQRYIRHLPSAGEIAFFDRSWYNRAVVEPVFGFCTPKQRADFFAQAPQFESMLVEDGIHLIKIWLTVSRAEQLNRFLAREEDPLKHWKLSPIDVQGLSRWDAYSEAIREMFEASHNPVIPWTVVRTDDKKRARLAAIRHVLNTLPYAGKDFAAIGKTDTALCGGPEIMPDENV
ncbi:polyphosphate kinase 2 [Paroceanicella profunda]|uniref:ADP/GDP-polyphosphate phosphotransferase n=1 Tax=Paroceanicella profunda TaxID=2579971 RepID=A0A5B8FVL5_9RHOB|nr:polyphosphate kinase 2 [Paroceanicella profunda]QDL92856.1 polyphosphate kinase 2 [Paroceanicella profunda]